MYLHDERLAGTCENECERAAAGKHFIILLCFPRTVGIVALARRAPNQGRADEGGEVSELAFTSELVRVELWTSDLGNGEEFEIRTQTEQGSSVHCMEERN